MRNEAEPAGDTGVSGNSGRSGGNSGGGIGLAGLAGYADLPDEILQSILGQAAEVASGVRSLFTHLSDRRDLLRTSLVLGGHVRSVQELPAVEAETIAAVDGGAAVDRNLGSDTALAVAVGIEGLTPQPLAFWSGVQHAFWQRTVPHEGEETLATCRGIMASLELSVLRDAPHDVVFLDGSHLTPVISLNAMLGVRNEVLRSEIAAAVTEQRTAEALRTVLTRSNVVALVKYDSSRDLSNTWLEGIRPASGAGLDDRTTMSLLLEPGEYTEPVSLTLTQQSRSNWLTRQIPALTPADAARETVRAAVNDAISGARNNQLLATYYKPHPWSPAYRIEIKKAVAEQPDLLARTLHAVRSQVISPEIREPYPQWVADRMAKSVSDALIALRTAVHYDLADSGLANLISLLSPARGTAVPLGE
ncbi:MAG: hypothetical protein OHK0029_00960 [Armatimonadaceae bacterium]